jgi:xanthine dehydrogenase YagT iron-sulfur-binding subunit
LREGKSVKAGVTRRQAVAAALGTAAVLALDDTRAWAQASTPPQHMPAAGGTVVLKINGTDHQLRIDPRVTLLDALRERLGLTGAKKGCDHGQCGSCTVLVDGRRVNSCLTLAVRCAGHEVTTIEGLARGDELHPLQAAFIKHDGFQCGFCTPGQIMSAAALLDEGCGPSDADVAHGMCGNLCRCGAYPGIVAAVQEVRKGSRHAPV